jgi:hypothetical protein
LNFLKEKNNKNYNRLFLRLASQSPQKNYTSFFLFPKFIPQALNREGEITAHNEKTRIFNAFFSPWRTLRAIPIWIIRTKEIIKIILNISGGTV